MRDCGSRDREIHLEGTPQPTKGRVGEELARESGANGKQPDMHASMAMHPRSLLPRRL